MNWLLSVLLAVFFAAHARAFDCSVKELQPYDLKGLKGVYTSTITKKTPPSESTIEWLIGVCEDLGLVQSCSPDSDVCGKTTVTNGDKSLLTEIFEFKFTPSTVVKALGDEGKEGFAVEYHDVEWSDQKINANVFFKCVDAKDAQKEFETRWENNILLATLKTDKACIKADRKPGDGGRVDNGESWGWFTWIFIFMVLFLSIYIIGGAWFQYNKGNSIDFQSALKEVLENFLDLLRGLPVFIKEIIEKFTRNNNRGEYSAV